MAVWVCSGLSDLTVADPKAPTPIIGKGNHITRSNDCPLFVGIMKTTSIPKLPGVFLSAVSFAIGVALVFAIVPMSARAQQLPELCREDNGTWLEEYKECESVSQQWCKESGGHFEACESACRHASNPGPCTMQCVPVCKFPISIGKDGGDGTRLRGRESVAVKESQAEEPKALSYLRDSEPQLFSYDELVQLSQDQPMSSELAEKLRIVTTTPFINNEAYYAGAKPRPLQIKELGSSLRVAFWNIERGLSLDDIQLFLTDKDRFIVKVKEERKKAKENGQKIRAVNLEKIPQEIELLKAADVWILNEVDWGVKRTQYREVVRELAETLNMNWAYGTEFLEIDPKQLGTETFEYQEDEKARQQLLEQFRVDKDRMRALHGNAVLSRYPIREARLVPFKVGYDWFKESKITALEKGKRKAAKLIGEELLQELRRGGRTTLFVDLDVPEMSGKRLTIVATHLENRTKPKVRRQQMEELLGEIREIRNPVVIAGDWNTSGSNSTPTSAQNMLYKRYGSTDFWTTKGIQWATGLGLVYSGSRAARKLAGIQYRVDPTSANLPGLSPNLERGLFDSLERFRFADGRAFDFRGVPARTVNGMSGTLADSNQRASKGFIPTFATELVWGKLKVAKFKLDWIFVKSELKNPRDPKGPYVFAPHFARTFVDLNNCPPEPLSDHSPITVDLPFHEPPYLGDKKH
jgi:endonuclease/exonuclease/phosphatase family metal-dependent hydrolase